MRWLGGHTNISDENYLLRSFPFYINGHYDLEPWFWHYVLAFHIFRLQLIEILISTCETRVKTFFDVFERRLDYIVFMRSEGVVGYIVVEMTNFRSIFVFLLSSRPVLNCHIRGTLEQCDSGAENRVDSIWRTPFKSLVCICCQY